MEQEHFKWAASIFKAIKWWNGFGGSRQAGSLSYAECPAFHPGTQSFFALELLDALPDVRLVGKAGFHSRTCLCASKRTRMFGVIYFLHARKFNGSRGGKPVDSAACSRAFEWMTVSTGPLLTRATCMSAAIRLEVMDLPKSPFRIRLRFCASWRSDFASGGKLCSLFL